MYTVFFVSVVGLIAIIPFYFLSVEHLKLQKRYGLEKGTKIGVIFGLISGWSFFLFWMGIWVSPQPRFSIPILQNLTCLVPVISFPIPLFHLAVSTPFLIVGPLLAIKGVKETTLKTAETHRTERITTRGVYSIVRHPQYLGGLLSHVGTSFLLSAWYSLLLTPFVVALVFIISRKEEKEMIREFGKEYEDYKKKVPILIPRLRGR
jgi:protein-S-isoprenylcysteine O-methyltransferase Ste14